jgi:hypothetical protein
MPSINFMPRWADNVELGVYHANCMLPPVPLRVLTPKRCTIRAIGKRDYRPGIYLSLYTGLRTKQSRLLGIVLCLGVTPITIAEDYILIQGVTLDYDRAVQLAKVDTGGQLGLVEFMQLFDKLHDLPFTGQLISW